MRFIKEADTAMHNKETLDLTNERDVPNYPSVAELTANMMEEEEACLR